jgi:hypothetical protein
MTDSIAMMVQAIPTHNAEYFMPIIGESAANATDIRFKEPRAMFGTVVATVALRLVPNCSAAMVTKIAQKPTEIPKTNIHQYNAAELVKGNIKYPMLQKALNARN